MEDPRRTHQATAAIREAFLDSRRLPDLDGLALSRPAVMDDAQPKAAITPRGERQVITEDLPGLSKEAEAEFYDLRPSPALKPGCRSAASRSRTSQRGGSRSPGSASWRSDSSTRWPSHSLSGRFCWWDAPSRRLKYT